MSKEIRISFLNQWPEYRGLEQFRLRHPYDESKFSLIETSWQNSDLIIFGPFGGRRTSIGYGNKYQDTYEKYIKIMPILSSVQRKKTTLFVTGEYCSPLLPFCDYSISFSKIPSSNHLYQPEWVTNMWELGYDVQNLVYTKKTQESFDRSFCNFIYTRKLEWRDDYYHLLSKIDEVDSFGISFTEKKPVKITYKEKIKLLEKYKFTISIENKKRRNYITEKIIHPIIAGSIPIYLGSKDITKVFNPDHIIDVGKYSNEELVSYIYELENSKDKYLQRLHAPIFLNNKIPTEAKKETSAYFLNKVFTDSVS